MQHLGDRTVRCISMDSTDGLRRAGGLRHRLPIKVPVGEEVLGRMVNVLGKPIDNLLEIEAKDYWQIHREPPKLAAQIAQPEMLETALRSTCSALSWAER